MSQPSSRDEHATGSEPTILLVAEGERLAPALVERLGQHGAVVELATPSAVVTAAFVGAPDVIVLAGQAALDGGEEILAALARQAGTSSVPVILIADPRAATGKLDAFRHGVVAVIDRTASADEMARRIAEVARDLPERPGEATGTLEASSLDEVVALFAQSLRSGILAVTGEPGGASAQVVLRPDRPIAEAIAELVERLKPMLARGDRALSYEFHESPPGRISSIDLGDEDAAQGSLEGVRLLVIQANAARADLLAQELRAAKATVAVADGSGAGLELAHDLAPDVIVMDGSGVDSWALDALRAIRRDARLRSASLLVMDSDALWKDARRPNVALLSAKVEALLELDRDVESRVRAKANVGTRLDVLGPIRLLRALVRTELGLAVSIVHPRLCAHVDLADGLVVGASVRLPTSQKPLAEGPAALASILGLNTGRVQITRADAPKSANIMAPIDAALAAAAREKPAVAPSLPAPSHSAAPAPVRSMRPSIPNSLGGGDLPALVGRLEELVQHLKTVEPELEGQALPSSESPRSPAIAPPAPSAALAATSSYADASPDEDHTGTYSPAVMDQLRRRMRHSSTGLRAVKGPAPSGATAAAKVAAAGAAAEPARPAGITARHAAGAPPPGRVPPPRAAASAFSSGAGGKAPLPKPTSKTLVFGAVSGQPGAPAAPVSQPTSASAARALAAPPTVTTPAAAASTATPPAATPTVPTPTAAASAATPPPTVATRAAATAAPPTVATAAVAAAPSQALGGKPGAASLTGGAPGMRGRRSATLVGIPSPVRAPEPKTAERALPPPRPHEAAEIDAEVREAAPAMQEPGAALDALEPEATVPGFTAVEIELDERSEDTREIPSPPEPSEMAMPAARPGPPPPPAGPPAMAPFSPPAPPAHPEPPAASLARAALHSTPPMPFAPPISTTPATPRGDRDTPALPVTLASPGAAPRSRWRLALLGGFVLGLCAVAFFTLVPRAPTITGTLPPVPPGTTTSPIANVLPSGPTAGTTGALPIPPPTGAPLTAEASTPTATPSPPPVADLAPAADPVPPPVAAPEAAPATAASSAGVGARLPLGPSDPIEGRPEDFDLARLGITPEEPPSTRRALTRRVSTLLAEGYRFRSRGDLDRAEASYRSLLAIDPENPRATAGLALVHADRGDALASVLFAQRLTRLRPEYASNFLLLGDRYLAAGDSAAARRTFEHVLELEPGHAGARERLATLP